MANSAVERMTSAQQTELDRLLAAPRTFREFVTRAMPSFEWYPAQRLIADALERVAQDRLRRLMIFMPPQEGKSELVSKLFPAYYLQCHPDRWVGVGSYSFGLAKTFSRAARNYYRDVVTDLSDEAAAVELWETPRKGGLWAVGRGGSATGRPAHLLIVDDPLKDRQEAESETIRQTLHDWHGGVLNMRLQPENAEVVVHCMTGDTRVLLANGTERPLSHIRPGDYIASYTNGSIGTAIVSNWKSQGLDCIFAIKTSGGVVVRANARHPFLIARGERTEWVKVKDLRIGDRILRVIGANGAAFDAHSRDAARRPYQKDTAHPTTTRLDGLREFGRHLSIQPRDEKPTYATATVSASLNTTLCETRRTDDAPFAESFPATTSAPIGAGNCASITMQVPERFAHFSATTATSPWDTERQKPPFYEPLSTCEITHDVIVEIVASGREEVFDIEVLETETFIANGLVSHNTRWHEDDLAGHLLAIERTTRKPQRWTILELPGISEHPADRPTYPPSCVVIPDWRKPGQPLGGRYGLDRYEQVLAISGTREFESQVQQRPAPAQGTIFKRSWWKRYPEEPARFDRVIISADCSFKDADDSDYVALHVWGRIGAELYLLDRVHERLSFTNTKAALKSMMAANPNAVVYVEDKANGSAIIDSLQQELLGVLAVEPEGGKVARAYACQGDVEHGRVWLPSVELMPDVEDFIREAASFPSAPNDDDVDAFTQAVAVYRMELRAALPTKRSKVLPDHHPGFDPETHKRLRPSVPDGWQSEPARAPVRPRVSHRGGWT